MTAIDRRTLLASVAGTSALAVLGATALAGPADAATAGRPTLRMGYKGNWVRSAQQFMSDSGYWLGAVDGSFGPLMQQAVWAVQKNRGLPRDGVVGPATWDAIAMRYRVWPRYSGDHIEVDKARQLLIVARGGRGLVTLNTSTGSGRAFTYYGRRMVANTPSGTFSIYRKNTIGWEYGALGGLYKPFYFNGGIAVHGAPSIPPYPDSHGCCRVSTSAQDYLISSGALQMSERVYVY
ncbi:L,D-transpeptidase family protein [Dermatophilaceae bacterium Sec6.4]|nr:L,D-transpeptidase family protein [Actinomycetota bacterium]